MWLDGKLLLKYMMASVKTTNRGVYGQNKVLMDEMLESLADLILEGTKPRDLESYRQDCSI
jgi:hypothetical protein